MCLLIIAGLEAGARNCHVNGPGPGVKVGGEYGKSDCHWKSKKDTV